MDIEKMINEILSERILCDGFDAKGWKKYNDGIKKSVQVIRQYQSIAIADKVTVCPNCGSSELDKTEKFCFNCSEYYDI